MKESQEGVTKDCGELDSTKLNLRNNDDLNKENRSENIISNISNHHSEHKFGNLLTPEPVKTTPPKSHPPTQTSSSLSSNLSKRVFVPKSQRQCPSFQRECKLEFKLSSEKTICLTVSQDSNPLKLAEYLTQEVEASHKDNGTQFTPQYKGKLLVQEVRL